MEQHADMRFDHGRGTPKRLRRQFARLVGMTAAQTHRIAHRALSEVGARKDHYIVLSALDSGGPASQAQLADRAGIYRSDLVATVNELSEGGHVRREPDPDDRRRNVITMTPSGAERLEQLDAILAAVHEEILGPFSAEEREQLYGLLTRLNAHLAERA